MGAAMLEPVARAWPFFFGEGRRERPWGKGRLVSVEQYCHQAELVCGSREPTARGVPGSEVGAPGGREGARGPKVPGPFDTHSTLVR